VLPPTEGQSQSFHAYEERSISQSKDRSLSEGSIPVIFISMEYTNFEKWKHLFTKMGGVQQLFGAHNLVKME
jgi:hypothetical protein